MPINSFLYPAPSTPTFPYQVANSLRFNDGSSDYLNRTSSSGDRRQVTISAWVKRSHLGTEQQIYGFGNSASNVFTIYFDGSDDTLRITDYQSGGTLTIETNRKFRDVSAWYHILVAIDTDQGTASDRVKVYINGVQETSFSSSTYPNQNTDLYINVSGQPHHVGVDQGPGRYFDGYMCEVVLIDGQQLDPTSFGEFDSDSPTIWKPIDVSGLTFGNNGFYLDFEDSSALGNDVSGNDNDFSVNNLTATDQSTDTCTNNFATWNPLHPGVTRFDNCVFADGNLEFESNETGYVVYPIAKSTIGVSSGKWYAEFKVLEENAILGISDGISDENYIGGSTSNGVAYQKDGQKRVGNSQSSYGDSYTADDIIGVAMDLDNNRVFFSKNGTFQDSGDPTSSTGAITIPSSSTGVFHFATLDTVSSGTSKVTANFGSPAFSISSGNSDANGHGNFEYSVPSGYFALCTKNLAEFG